MTETELPIGALEGPDLEFKRAGILKNLYDLGRVVVGMLNARGGTIWVGVEERDEAAVGLVPVADPAKQRRRIEDHLADAVEPALRSDEVRIDAVPIPGDGEVLRIRVRPEGSRGPYELVRGSAHEFPLRVGARSRPMTREEIRERFVIVEKDEDEEAKAERSLLAERAQVFESGFSGMLLLIVPVGAAEIPAPSGKLYEYFRDPRLTGNRPHGWSFVNPYVEPPPKEDRLVVGEIESAQTTVWSDGRLRFMAATCRLSHDLDGRQQILSSYALCEFPVSVFRLGKALYERFDSTKLSGVVADLSLLRVRGWVLRPYSDDAIRHRLETAEPLADDSILPQLPLHFTRKEILQNPDRCARRLVLRVYNAFGYIEEHLPRQFQNDQHRFVME